MWTPSALASEIRGWHGIAWRVVEAQHRISTNRLASSLADQARLEELAEAAKPALPVAARGKHYLLAAPFRYGHKMASRFRRADVRPGIFYASEHEHTAIAETAYWRLRFLTRSPGMIAPQTTSEHLSFTIALATDRAIDLTCPPFDRDRDKWRDPADYAACQQLADAARAGGVILIRSDSARDPDHRANLVLLDPAGFAASQPDPRQTWHFRYEAGGLDAIAAFPSPDRLRFSAGQFGL